MISHHFSKFITQQHCSPSEGFELIAYKLSELVESGSSCLDLSTLEIPRSNEEWIDFLHRDQKESAVGSPDTTHPLILTNNGKLYLQRYFLHEFNVVKKINAAAKTETQAIGENLTNNIKKLFKKIQGNDQAQAAICALKNRLTIISGGPGTGKTTTVLKILRLLADSGQYSKASDCLLLAPTGKAADRLRQSILSGIEREQISKDNIPTETSTIHRALGYQHGSIEFKHNAKNPLQVHVVVIDEVSMVDLPLMARLLDAIPEQAKIILLGDKNQLTSVQVGTVLSDLMEAAKSNKYPIHNCAVVLRKSYRTQGDVSKACKNIRAGDSQAAWKTIQNSKKGENGSITLTAPPKHLRQALEPFVKKHWLPILLNNELSIEEKIQHIDRFRILSPTHQGTLGIESINNCVNQILASNGVIQTEPWFAGRSVIVQKNDYPLGIYNGDIGLTLRKKENDPLLVHFSSGEKTKSIPPALLPECQTAWALTIHRTQGSEYDHILLIIPPSEQSKILSRELLYTGLSRAKKSATIWCNEQSFSTTVNKTIQRASGLVDMHSHPKLSPLRSEA